jgi:hypothetical protein
MDEQLIYYLTLISKLSHIITYIKTHINEKDSYDLSSYIQECKTICINLVKSEPLIQLFLQEIKQEQNNIQTIIPVLEQNPQDIELKEQLDTLAILLTGTIQTNENEPISSNTFDTFDTFGSGISRIFKVIDTTPTVVTIPQLKNEINNNSSNINFEIKRK